MVPPGAHAIRMPCVPAVRPRARTLSRLVTGELVTPARTLSGLPARTLSGSSGGASGSRARTASAALSSFALRCRSRCRLSVSRGSNAPQSGRAIIGVRRYSVVRFGRRCARNRPASTKIFTHRDTVSTEYPVREAIVGCDGLTDVPSALANVDNHTATVATRATSRFAMAIASRRMD